MAYVREKMSSMPLKDLIGELKSYNQPPEVVTQVMQGVLLLVGRVKSVKDAPEWRKGVHQQMNDPLVKECLALDASAQGRNKAWLESKKATKSLTSDEVLKRGSAAVQVFQKWLEACRMVRTICEQLRNEEKALCAPSAAPAAGDGDEEEEEEEEE